MGRKPDLLTELTAADPTDHTAILKNAAERRRQRFWFNGYFTGVLGYAVMPYLWGAVDPPPPMLVRIFGMVVLAWLPGAVILGAATITWPSFFGDLRSVDGFLKPWVTGRSSRSP